MGSRLALEKGTVCSKCYALKGRYGFPTVQNAQERRLKTIEDPRWVDAMVTLINGRKIDYFRWHDSGDIQNVEHLLKIIAVAVRCPDTKFWLPTREASIVRMYIDKLPPNLVVRVSGMWIDGKPPEFPNTSTVVTDKAKVTCPAYNQGGKCENCRDCWQKHIRNVAYPKH